MYKELELWEFYGYTITVFKEVSMKKKIQTSIAKKDLLMDDITKTRQALERIYCNFQYVSDPDLIDCYIYEMNSVDLRYKYLINQLRELNIAEHAN